MDIARVDRYSRYGLLVSAVVFGGLDYAVAGQNVWFKSFFVITVAGLVGYFTNYLAIKMLFQPKHGQVLGWRGLVPKNQGQIAQSLGASVQEQLLSPDIILEYIRERGLIEAATQSAGRWLDRGLQQPEVRRAITTRLIALLDDRGRDIITGGFDLSEQALKRLAQNPEVIEGYWEQLRRVLQEFLRSEENRELAAERLQRLVLMHLPQIAEWLDVALEDYLRSRRVAGSVGLGLKSLISLDREALEQLLTRFAEDPQVAERLMQGLDAAFDALQRQLEKDATQELVQAQLASWVEHLAGLFRQHLLPASVEQLDAYLNNEENWVQIEDLLMRAIGWFKEQAVRMLASEDGQAYLRSGIERAVKQLNVTELVEAQVMKLDTDELESMVLDNTGGNLTIIQVLGGALGVIAGTVQVHVLFALPLTALVLLVYAAWQINEWRQRRVRA